jgi:hypothetical protein
MQRDRTPCYVPPRPLRAHARQPSRTAGRRAFSLELAPPLSVMSYIDLADADRRVVQRTDPGIAVGRGCPSILRTNGRPTLARSRLTLRALYAASCSLELRPVTRQGRSRCPVGRSLCGCPRRFGVALIWRASSPGTVAWSGSRGVCSAQRSVALPPVRIGDGNGRGAWAA